MDIYAGRKIDVISRGERVIEAVYAGEDPGATIRLKGRVDESGNVKVNGESKYFCHKNRFTFPVNSPYYEVREEKKE